MVNAVTGLDIRLEIKIEDEWTKVAQLKTVPDIGGAPEKIDASHKESTMQEFIGGLQTLPDMNFVCIPEPGKIDASDIIAIFNKMSREENYEFRIDYPRMGYRVTGAGEFYPIISGSTNADLQEFQIQIVPSRIDKPMKLTGAYKMIYNVNGGSGTVIDIKSPYSPGAVVIVQDGPTPPVGKVFVSWNYNQDGSGQVRYAGETFKIYGDTTLYAIYVDE